MEKQGRSGSSGKMRNAIYDALFHDVSIGPLRWGESSSSQSQETHVTVCVASPFLQEASHRINQPAPAMQICWHLFGLLMSGVSLAAATQWVGSTSRKHATCPPNGSSSSLTVQVIRLDSTLCNRWFQTSHPMTLPRNSLPKKLIAAFWSLLSACVSRPYRKIENTGEMNT